MNRASSPAPLYGTPHPRRCDLPRTPRSRDLHAVRRKTDPAAAGGQVPVPGGSSTPSQRKT